MGLICTDYYQEHTCPVTAWKGGLLLRREKGPRYH